MIDANDKTIKFHFAPSTAPGGCAVEKDAGAGKRRYLVGVATGLKPDQQGERVTQHCIDSMVRQAKEGDVLLFPDLHGMGDSKDIGLLESFKVLDNGDWYVEFRLYDEADGVPKDKLDVIDTLWRQVNGFPPYRKPRQKGFSIEGYIPSQNGLFKRDAYNQIDEIVLQGAIVTPIPAYKDSVAHAVYKALGEKAPWVIRKDLKSRLYDSLIEREARDAYEAERWNVQSALDEEIRTVMTEDCPDREGRLKMLFEEYGDLMVELIMRSAAVFQDDAAQAGAPDEASPYSAGLTKAEAFARLRANLEELSAIRKENKV